MEIIKIQKKIIGWKIPGKEDPKQSIIDNRPTEILHSSAPKRPKSLPCEINFSTYKGKKWAMIVGLLNGKPYEIFVGYSEHLQIPSKYTKGNIIKTSRGSYNLEIDLGKDEEPLVIKNIVEVFANPEAAWTTRCLSLSLRHGVPIEFIVEQLNKDGIISDINKVLARVFKKYIVDGKKVSGTKCSACGSTNLVYESGCMKCLDCNDSKCG